MEEVKVSQIEKQLRRLSPDKLAVVLDFVSYLADRQSKSEAFQTMVASEAVLGRAWDRPEEDTAWANL